LPPWNAFVIFANEVPCDNEELAPNCCWHAGLVHPSDIFTGSCEINYAPLGAVIVFFFVAPEMI
jgi:hypothetical protein